LGSLVESEIAPVSFTLVLFVSLFCFVAVSAVLLLEDAVVLLTASVDGECNTPPPTVLKVWLSETISCSSCFTGLTVSALADCAVIPKN